MSLRTDRVLGPTYPLVEDESGATSVVRGSPPRPSYDYETSYSASVTTMLCSAFGLTVSLYPKSAGRCVCFSSFVLFVALVTTISISRPASCAASTIHFSVS